MIPRVILRPARSITQQINSVEQPLLTTMQRTIRCFSESSSTNQAFDRHLKRLQRNRAARFQEFKDPVDYDYFREEIARRLVDRLDDIKTSFPLALDLGAGSGMVHRLICSDDSFDGVGGIGGVRKLVQLDSSEFMLHRDDDRQVEGAQRCGTYKMKADEEGKLPFPDGTFDLVMSNVSMHWINELPAVMAEIHRVLKPNGCFLFAMVGGSTLPELRASLVMAELERDGGVSPHVGPFCELSDIGSILSGAGFQLPTIDVDTIKVAYPNSMVLMEHLQRMGEGNACINRKPRTSLDTFLASACIYDQQFGLETDEGIEDDTIEASVQVIFAIGWSPHESQQKPLKRGTATLKVGEIVEVEHTKR
jgi:NADH dehydrogenase [ubiquinone] 1 alpha subcomplex assembly factor 5